MRISACTATTKPRPFGAQESHVLSGSTRSRRHAAAASTRVSKVAERPGLVVRTDQREPLGRKLGALAQPVGAIRAATG